MRGSIVITTEVYNTPGSEERQKARIVYHWKTERHWAILPFMPVVLHTESLRLGPGGQTIRLAQEARRLNSINGWSCHVAGRSPGPLDADLLGEDWYHPFRFNRSKFHPGSLLRAIRLLKQIRPDIIHTHSSYDAWVFGVAGRILGLPIVRGRHSSWPLKKPAIRNFAYTQLADAFTVSGATIGRILTSSGIIREDKVFDTAGGFDQDRFDPDRVDRELLHRELGLATGARIIGAVCMVRPTKGIDILVDAFSRLPDDSAGAGLHLVIAGTVSDEDRASLTSASPGRIHFLGYRDDIEDIIGSMDLLIVPSRKADGVPQVIPQAMALRVPVIGARAAGIPDVITDGETGFLVPPEDPVALTARIVSVLSMTPADMAALLERARCRSLERHTFDSIVETYLSAYNYLLG
ncbi:MAG: glycosyltransferase [Candidatus Krumholzibacteriota bacterium]|nr:glycosyltransferase [Candidatus Krumholzibacteriota bacterium]